MKRIVVITLSSLVLFAVALMYSVWRESQAPVSHTPGPLETGRAQLRAQLETAKKTEATAETEAWGSAEKLRALAQAHQQRIDKLKDNKEAAEIVAYDRDAIERLTKRIAQIAEEEAAKAEAAKAEAAKAEAAKQAAAKQAAAKAEAAKQAAVQAAKVPAGATREQ
jgi:membrane protein involved in colicin uptake